METCGSPSTRLSLCASPSPSPMNHLWVCWGSMKLHASYGQDLRRGYQPSSHNSWTGEIMVQCQNLAKYFKALSTNNVLKITRNKHVQWQQLNAARFVRDANRYFRDTMRIFTHLSWTFPRTYWLYSLSFPLIFSREKLIWRLHSSIVTST